MTSYKNDYYKELEKQSMQKRVFIYIRVSTTEQAEEGYSLGEQEERLKKYCEAMGWIVVRIFCDPGYSGSNIKRPAMDQMIKAIEKGEADIVLVDKLDRLSRSQFDTLYLIQKIFNENDVAFVSRAEAFDTSTPFGRAMVGILAVFAELERERIKERMIDGKIGRAKEGKYAGGNGLTYGFNYNPESGALEENKYESMIVNQIFEMISERTPLKQIADILNNKGYRTKNKKAWNDTVIRYMATNKTYIGNINHKGEWYDGLHDGIVPIDLFNRVQDIMKERDIKYENYKPGKRYTAPLSSLIWCGHCNAKYGVRRTSKRKDGSYYRYYMCHSKAKCDPSLVKDPNCKNRNYQDTVLNEAIFNEIRKLKSDPIYFDEIRQSIDPSIKIELIEKQIEEINNKISRFMDLYSVDGIDIASIKDKIKPLSEERSLLEDELHLIEHQKPSVMKEDVMYLVDLFEETLKEGDCNKIHNVIMELIDYIVIDNDEVKIHWNF